MDRYMICTRSTLLMAEIRYWVMLKKTKVTEVFQVFHRLRQNFLFIGKEPNICLKDKGCQEEDQTGSQTEFQCYLYYFLHAVGIFFPLR